MAANRSSQRPTGDRGFTGRRRPLAGDAAASRAYSVCLIRHSPWRSSDGLDRFRCHRPDRDFSSPIYNKLVGGRNAYKNAFAQIDVQLTRRHDLIPNLVETAKGYMKHERETLEAVITARNAAVTRLEDRLRRTRAIPMPSSNCPVRRTR